MEFSPDGETFATQTEKGGITLWSAKDLTEKVLLASYGRTIFNSPDMSFSRDGSMIASVVDQEGVSVWDTASGKKVINLACDNVSGLDVAFSPDGKYILCGSNGRKNSVLMDIASGEKYYEFNCELISDGFIRQVEFSPDGRIAINACGYGIAFWDVETKKRLGEFPGGYEILLSPDGQALISSGDGLFIWDMAPIYDALDNE